MRYSKILIMTLLLVSILPLAARAQNSKDEVYTALLDKYKDIETVTVDFILEENPNFTGRLVAKIGNKYRISFGVNTITCDGSTIWNYSVDDNKVVISTFEEAAAGELSLENIFFGLLENYKPTSLKKVNTSGGAKAYMLTLEPGKEAISISELQLTTVNIWIDRNDYTLLSVQIDDGEAIQTWNMKNLKTNKKIGDKDFTFEVPEDARIVDLR